MRSRDPRTWGRSSSRGPWLCLYLQCLSPVSPGWGPWMWPHGRAAVGMDRRCVCCWLGSSSYFYRNRVILQRGAPPKLLISQGRACDPG